LSVAQVVRLQEFPRDASFFSKELSRNFWGHVGSDAANESLSNASFGEA
jgi:hypothetical protein